MVAVEVEQVRHLLCRVVRDVLGHVEELGAADRSGAVAGAAAGAAVGLCQNASSAQRGLAAESASIRPFGERRPPGLCCARCCSISWTTSAFTVSRPLAKWCTLSRTPAMSSWLARCSCSASWLCRLCRANARSLSAGSSMACGRSAGAISPAEVRE